METKRAYSREEAAQQLGISLSSVDRLIKRKLLKPSRALRRVLISDDELKRFLAVTSERI